VLSLLAQAPSLVPVDSARDELTAFNARRLKLLRGSMGVIGSWALVNMAGAGVGWALSRDDRARTFWEGTAIWNTVNLGLGVIGLLMSRHDDSAELDLKASLSQGDTYEKLFLFNGGLDVAYFVGAAFLLEHGSRTGEVKWTGYGNALLVQAGFLLVFDLALFFLHRRIDQQLMNRLVPTPNGVGLTF